VLLCSKSLKAAFNEQMQKNAEKCSTVKTNSGNNNNKNRKSEQEQNNSQQKQNHLILIGTKSTWNVA
jgi:hypothetical protein